MKRALLFPVVVVTIVSSPVPRANGQLTIIPAFDTSITSLPNATQVEDGIQQAIDRVEADIENPITVTIDFVDNTSIDLGESNSLYNPLPYPTYLSDLENNQILSANDMQALSTLPAGPDNPVNGTQMVDLNLPLLRALGETALGNNDGQFDGTISLNLNATYDDRSDPQPSEYDLQSVAAHEIDEVLGIGGAGSTLASGTSGDVGPLDLFRYSAPGVRSYTQSDTAVSYFSIDGGNTDLVHFNQDPSGDFGDWGNGTTPATDEGNSPAQVQDAFGTPGVNVNIGANELIALDVVGYNLEPVPEPGIGCSLLASAALLAWRRKRPARARQRCVS